MNFSYIYISSFIKLGIMEKPLNNANKFFVSEHCYPQTLSILKTRSEPLDIELVVGA